MTSSKLKETIQSDFKTAGVRAEFWTSTEYLSFMSGLMRELRNNGMDAVQLFHVSYGDYRLVRSSVSRLWLRFRMYVLYPLILAWHCLTLSKSCILVVCTNTFYAPLVASFFGRNRKLVHLVYDLYPDVLIHAGSLQEGSTGAKVLDSITQMTFKRSVANVFLGDHLLAHARKRFGNIPNPKIIAVGADGEDFRKYPPQPRPSSDPIKILYCGNLGRMHDTQTLCLLFRDPTWQPTNRLQFSFHANGAGFKILQQESSSFVQRGSVELSFGSVLSDADWVKRMLESDVALVTMISGAEEVVMPSKTYSALVAGQAILAICPDDSDLALLVRKHDCGWVVSPGDTKGLKTALDEICGNPQLLLARRENSFRAGHGVYDAKTLSRQWTELFAQLAEEHS